MQDDNADIGMDVFHELVSSDRVEGIKVFNLLGDEFGYVKRLIVSKVAGIVEFVIVGNTGFLGLFADSYAVPWSLLNYFCDQEAYVMMVDLDLLAGAPHFDAKTTGFTAEYAKQVHEYYASKLPEYPAAESHPGRFRRSLATGGSAEGIGVEMPAAGGEMDVL